MVEKKCGVNSGYGMLYLQKNIGTACHKLHPYNDVWVLHLDPQSLTLASCVDFTAGVSWHGKNPRFKTTTLGVYI